MCLRYALRKRQELLKVIFDHSPRSILWRRYFAQLPTTTVLEVDTLYRRTLQSSPLCQDLKPPKHRSASGFCLGFMMQSTLLAQEKLDFEESGTLKNLTRILCSFWNWLQKLCPFFNVVIYSQWLSEKFVANLWQCCVFQKKGALLPLSFSCSTPLGDNRPIPAAEPHQSCTVERALFVGRGVRAYASFRW